VIGHTQWLGTCKFHIFKDCPRLNAKRRDAHFQWGTRPGSKPNIEQITHDPNERQICKACRNREARQILAEARRTERIIRELRELGASEDEIARAIGDNDRIDLQNAGADLPPPATPASKESHPGG